MVTSDPPLARLGSIRGGGVCVHPWALLGKEGEAQVLGSRLPRFQIPGLPSPGSQTQVPGSPGPGSRFQVHV